MKILIVVDMQNDFIDGSLGSKEAKEIVPAVCEKIKWYNSNRGNVMCTFDTHYENYLNTLEGKKLPVLHCVDSTIGWELNKEISDSISDKAALFKKKSFGSISLAMLISSLTGGPDYIDSIELVGVCTDICVVSNAIILKAAFPETQIIVDAKCCAGTTTEKHEAALKTMESCQIDIVNWNRGE